MSTLLADYSAPVQVSLNGQLVTGLASGLNFSGAGIASAVVNPSTGAVDILVSGGGGGGTTDTVARSSISGLDARTQFMQGQIQSLSAGGVDLDARASVSGLDSRTQAIQALDLVQTNSISGLQSQLITNQAFDNVRTSSISGLQAQLITNQTIDNGRSRAISGLDTRTQAIQAVDLAQTRSISGLDTRTQAIQAVDLAQTSSISGLATLTTFLQAAEPIKIGFDNRTTSILSFTPSTATLNISGLAYTVWNTNRLSKSGQDSVAIPSGTTGFYYSYFDQAGTLQQALPAAVNFSNSAIVSAVYWNSGTGAFLLQEERHGHVMDWCTHEYLHDTRGAVLASGCVPSSYTLSPSTPADADIQVAVGVGVINDEDIEYTVDALPAGGPYSVWYRLGTAGNWTSNTANTVPFVYTAASYINYNQFTGSTWQLTPLGNNQYINYYLFAVPVAGQSAQHRYVWLPGQTAYASLAAAQAATIANMQLGGFLSNEAVLLYQFTFRSSTTYTTTGKVRIEAVAQFVGNTLTITGITSATNHTNLAGRTLAQQHPAGSIYTDTSNFSGLLSTLDSTVQQALDTLDDHGHTSYVTSISGLDVRTQSMQAFEQTLANSISGLSTGGQAGVDLVARSSISGLTVLAVDTQTRVTNLTPGNIGGLIYLTTVAI